MASILKITTTINVESDILGKDAGILVKDLIKEVTPAIRKAVQDYVSPEQPKEKEVK